MASMIAVLEDRIRSLADETATLTAKAEAAGSFDGVRERLDEIDALAPAVEADLARAKAATARIKSAPTAAVLTEGPVTPVQPFAAMPAGLADQFLGSDLWTDYLSRQKALFSPRVHIESPKVPIAGSLIAPFRPHGLVTGGATSGGAFILPGQSGIFDEGPLRRNLTILDLITRGTTDSDTVEFVRQTAFTNNAAIVLEADNVLDTDDTGRKPWSSLALERVSVGVETIAHGEAATSRALADAGQMRTLIESWLRYGLLEELEDEVLNGAGGTGHFTGITATANIQTQDFTTDIMTTIRKAKTKVRLNGKTNATGVVLHPNDWEALDLALTLGGTNSNRDAGTESLPRIWGLTIVESEAMDEGSCVVADFRRAVLWDRQQTTVQATTGYMDFFMKNLVAILAELRAGFGVVRPSAFVIADIAGS